MSCSPPSTSWSFDVPDWGYFMAGSSGRVIVNGWAETNAGQVYATAESPVVFADKKPLEILVPDDLVVNATGRTGTTVEFSVSARDTNPSSPGVSCLPGSGSLFPIGTTTVVCRARDAAGNLGTGSFVVHVKGAGEQLDGLAVAVRGVGPGRSLSTLVELAQVMVAKRQPKLACVALAIFRAEVTALAGRKIPVVQASTLVADARRITSVLGC